MITGITLIAAFWEHQAILKQHSPPKIKPRSSVQTPLPLGSPWEPQERLQGHLCRSCASEGSAPRVLGSSSSSLLSGLLGSNEEQTPFIHLRHSFLLGLGPEEGDVTKMQTDDGSQHLGWKRAADLGQAGATLCVCV